MEKSQKRKGFIRRLYRAARSAGKAKAKQSNLPAASTSLGSGSVGGNSFAVSSEMRSASYSNRSAAAVQKQASSAHGGFREGNGEMRGAYGGDEENVDVKAAMYILWVRERLKMERSMNRENSEIRVQKI